MPFVRSTLATALLAVLLAKPLSAQAESALEARPAPDTTGDVLVMDHDFAAPGEIVRVFLQSRQVYRAELSAPDLLLQIRAVGGQIRPPRVYPITGPESASQASVLELYPDVDGEYEIHAVGANGTGIATRMRLIRDVSASHRRMAVLGKPGWGVGFELATGWHSGFLQTTGDLTGTAHAGTEVEVCFSARAPHGAGLCVFGIGYQSQVGSKSILWFYTEPRLGLIGKHTSGWEIGPLFRVGVGSIERMSSTPWIFAPGAFIARQIRTNDQGHGWSIQAAYSHALYGGFPAGVGGADRGQPQSDHVALGLAWYH
ncbi:MAG TPA: hypothetical protein VH763_14055 [Gemmatimonadales bacterium]|jgi:hypothetical protein